MQEWVMVLVHCTSCHLDLSTNAVWCRYLLYFCVMLWTNLWRTNRRPKRRLHAVPLGSIVKSNIPALKLLNLSNLLRKRDKMLSKSHILSLFLSLFNKFINTWALMLLLLHLFRFRCSFFVIKLLNLLWRQPDIVKSLPTGKCCFVKIYADFF